MEPFLLLFIIDLTSFHAIFLLLCCFILPFVEQNSYFDVYPWAHFMTKIQLLDVLFNSYCTWGFTDREMVLFKDPFTPGFVPYIYT